MNPKLEPIISMFKTNSYLISRCLEEIKEGELTKRPNDKSNSLHFLIGHICASRFGIYNILGIEKQFPWPKIFSRGIEVTDDIEFPKLSEILKLWKKTNEDTLEIIANASDELLATNCELKFPVGDGSNLGAISFFAFHETYHVGQMAYLRRLLGYSQLVG